MIAEILLAAFAPSGTPSGSKLMALLDTSQDLDKCAAELGGEVGQLVTSNKRPLRDLARPWAIDNRAFTGFDADAFLALLKRYTPHRDHCLFVTVPDVVGSARRTLEVFERWAPRLVGWPLALVCQDGQENLPVPWDAINAVFIGGSTNWKGSDSVVQIVQAAQLLGKHVHVGRVNAVGRWKHFEELGVDTIDGTGISQYSHMREAIADRNLQLDWMETHGCP
jgi:hypothetical protein